MTQLNTTTFYQSFKDEVICEEVSTLFHHVSTAAKNMGLRISLPSQLVKEKSKIWWDFGKQRGTVKSSTQTRLSSVCEK